MHRGGILDSERHGRRKYIVPSRSAQVFQIGLNGSHEASHLLSYHHLTDLTTTWGYEIFSVYHGSTVEREVKPGTRPTPLKEGPLTWRLCPTHNQTSGSGPRSCLHPFLPPHKTGNPAVCEQPGLGGPA